MRNPPIAKAVVHLSQSDKGISRHCSVAVPTGKLPQEMNRPLQLEPTSFPFENSGSCDFVWDTGTAKKNNVESTESLTTSSEQLPIILH